MAGARKFRLPCREWLEWKWEWKVAGARCERLEMLRHKIWRRRLILEPDAACVSALSTVCRGWRSAYLPAATWRFSPLEHADDVKRLFLRKCIDRNGTRRSQPDHGDAFDCHVDKVGLPQETINVHTRGAEALKMPRRAGRQIGKKKRRVGSGSTSFWPRHCAMRRHAGPRHVHCGA